MALLAILVLATCWAVAEIHPWLVPLYLALMTCVLFAPQGRRAAVLGAESGGEASSDSSTAAHGGDGPANLPPASMVDADAVANDRPSSKDRNWNATTDATASRVDEPATAKAKRGKGRGKKAKPAPGGLTEAIWTQVAPGKFVRVDGFALSPSPPSDAPQASADDDAASPAASAEAPATPVGPNADGSPTPEAPHAGGSHFEGLHPAGWPGTADEDFAPEEVAWLQSTPERPLDNESTTLQASHPKPDSDRCVADSGRRQASFDGPAAVLDRGTTREYVGHFGPTSGSRDGFRDQRFEMVGNSVDNGIAPDASAEVDRIDCERFEMVGDTGDNGNAPDAPADADRIDPEVADALPSFPAARIDGPSIPVELESASPPSHVATALVSRLRSAPTSRARSGASPSRGRSRFERADSRARGAKWWDRHSPRRASRRPQARSPPRAFGINSRTASRE